MTVRFSASLFFMLYYLAWRPGQAGDCVALQGVQYSKYLRLREFDFRQ